MKNTLITIVKSVALALVMLSASSACMLLNINTHITDCKNASRFHKETEWGLNIRYATLALSTLYLLALNITFWYIIINKIFQ